MIIYEDMIMMRKTSSGIASPPARPTGRIEMPNLVLPPSPMLPPKSALGKAPAVLAPAGSCLPGVGVSSREGVIGTSATMVRVSNLIGGLCIFYVGRRRCGSLAGQLTCNSHWASN
jgi:hypothetical protein